MCRQKASVVSVPERRDCVGWNGACSRVRIERFQFWESRGKRNGIRLKIVKWRKGTTLVVGTRGWWQTMTGMKRKVAERSAALKWNDVKRKPSAAGGGIETT